MSEAATLLDFLRENVPLAAATQMRIGAYENDALTVTAPLAVNGNHHGTAFGGSLYVVALAAGWGLTDMLIREAGIRAATYVQYAEADYLRPVTGDLEARALRPEQAAMDAFLDDLRTQGRGRLNVVIGIQQDSAPAFKLRARFAAQTAIAGDDR